MNTATNPGIITVAMTVINTWYKVNTVAGALSEKSTGGLPATGLGTDLPRTKWSGSLSLADLSEFDICYQAADPNSVAPAAFYHFASNSIDNIDPASLGYGANAIWVRCVPSATRTAQLRFYNEG